MRRRFYSVSTAWVHVAAIVLVVTGAIAGVARAQTNPGSYQSFGDGRGFFNILPPGSDGSLNAAEAVAAQVGTLPAYFTDQLFMYRDLLYNAPGLTDDRILEFFKDASFGVRADDILRAYQPAGRTDVTIIRDASYGVPHVFGQTREGTMFGNGYATAEDRLFLMDTLRHVGRARLAEFLGGSPSNIAMDRDQLAFAPYLESDFTAMLDAAVTAAGADGPLVLADLLAYRDGINAYINEALLDPSKMPAEYGALQQVPVPWIPEDTVAIAVLVGGIFGKGGGGELTNHCRLKELAASLGSMSAARQVFDDLKFADDAEAPTSASGAFPYMSDLGTPDPAAHPDVDCSTLVPIDDGSSSLLDISTDPTELLESNLDAIVNGSGLLGGAPSLMSNAILIAGDHTATGRPIAVFGPQTGYFAPQLLVETDLHGPGIDARGVSFSGTGLYVQLGRGRDYAFSATSASGDNVDQWVLMLCEPGGGAATTESMGYLHQGQCKPIERWTHQEIAKPSAAGQPGIAEVACSNAADDDNDGFVNDGCAASGLPELVLQCLDAVDSDGDTLVNDGCPPILGNDIVLSFNVERSADYGPLAARGLLEDGTPIAIATKRTTYLNELGSVRGFYQINNPDFMAGGVEAFRQAMGGGVDYTFNWFYVDDTDIGYQASCLCPQRAQGVDPYLPAIGDGSRDWQGTIAFAEQPFDVNPAKGFLSSWNNKQAPGWLANDREFDYGPVYRSLMLDTRVAPLVAAGDATKSDMIDAMADAATTDLRGQDALALMLQVMGPTAPGGSDPRSQAMRDRLAAWLVTETHRRDFDHDGEYDDAQSAAIMDTWWKRAAHRMFDAGSGDAIDILGISLEDHNRRDHIGSAFQGEFVSQVNKDLRQVLALPVLDPFSRTYCGGGDLGQCRSDLWAAMDDAAASLEAEFASPNVADWKRTVADEEIRATVIGIVGVEPIPWQNRPTFQQVVQLDDGVELKCYASRDAPGATRFAETTATLVDAFETKVSEVRKPDTLCNAVAVAGRPSEAPDAAMACYRIKDARGQSAFTGEDVTVRAAFGEHALRARKARSLCVPTGVEALPIPSNIDHFKCYKSKLRAGTEKFAKRQVELEDAFDDKIASVVKPDLVCNAVDQDGLGVSDPDATLTCYKIRDAPGQAKFGGRTVEIANVFGAQTQSASKPRHLCVQSARSEP